MVADIAHELRTPLTVLQGNLEALRDGVVPPTTETLASLHEETLLLARLVSDLRDLSLAESGQLTLQRAPVDVADAGAAKRGIAAAAGGAGAAWRWRWTRRRGCRRLTRTRTGWRRCCGTCWRTPFATRPPGGEVLADGGRRRRRAAPAASSVTVADQGPGITPEELALVFERFYRADPSRSRASGGAGLGLAIVKQLVEAHGGQVWAESEPGQGSRFVLTIPLGHDRPAGRLSRGARPAQAGALLQSRMVS